MQSTSTGFSISHRGLNLLKSLCAFLVEESTGTGFSTSHSGLTLLKSIFQLLCHMSLLSHIVRVIKVMSRDSATPLYAFLFLLLSILFPLRCLRHPFPQSVRQTLLQYGTTTACTLHIKLAVIQIPYLA